MTQSGHLADHDKLKLSGMGADCIPSCTNDNVSATGMRRGRTFMKVAPWDEDVQIAARSPLSGERQKHQDQSTH